jgi:hypothetical protein
VASSATATQIAPSPTDEPLNIDDVKREDGVHVVAD